MTLNFLVDKFILEKKDSKKDSLIKLVQLLELWKASIQMLN